MSSEDTIYPLNPVTFQNIDKDYLVAIKAEYELCSNSDSGKISEQIDVIKRFYGEYYVEKLENENAWFNEKTNRKENVNKYIRFWNFPKVLWISINRSSYDGKKYMNLIRFPLELDLTQYCMGYNQSNT